ncbi:MAG: aspartate/glutamate racemase family protein, partial [Nitriliruptoraceae bacterium]
RRVLVIGTRLTAASGAYEQAVARLGLDIDAETYACPGFVELVEEGRADDAETYARVHQQLAPRLTARVDTLVLGCTHFPLLARPISEVAGRHITLVSSADETAFDVRDLLVTAGWQRTRSTADGGSLTVLTTGDPLRFRTLGAQFLGERLTDVRQHRIAALDRDQDAA